MRKQRPRSAKKRTLPPDLKSLITMFRSVHADLVNRAEHLKREPHDYANRKGVQSLHDLRNETWILIHAKDPLAAQRLAAEYGLRISYPELEGSVR